MLLWAMAVRRQRAKHPRAIDKQFSPHASGIETHYIGMKGEWAVARYLAMFPDIHAYAGGDGGVDMVYRGYSLDVKTLREWLVFNSLEDFKADIAVVVNPYGDERDICIPSHKTHWRRHVIIRGWATRQQFEAVCFKVDFGYGERLAMRTEQLNPILTLPLVTY